MKAGYRANGTFVLNRATQAAIRKLKDADGNYLWQPAAKAGEPCDPDGLPVAESEDMPDIAADSYSVAFGDFRRGYLIVDRVGIRVLRDPYSSKPYVLFYTTKRVGGGVQDFDAIKLLKFGRVGCAFPLPTPPWARGCRWVRGGRLLRRLLPPLTPDPLPAGSERECPAISLERPPARASGSDDGRAPAPSQPSSEASGIVAGAPPRRPPSRSPPIRDQVSGVRFQ